MQWSAFRVAVIAGSAALVVALASGLAGGGAAIWFEYRPIPFTLENCETSAKTVPEPMAGGVAVFDFNNDGRPDIFFTNGAEIPSLRKNSAKYSNRLFRNDGNGRFTDVTEFAGLRGTGYDTGVAVGDYDNDGFKDLFVAGVHRYTLYHNNGDGTFTDVTERAGISAADATFGPLWGVGGAWFDYNGDGKLDIFVVNYLRWDPKKEPRCPDYCHPNYYEGTPNRLYRNDGNGHFTDVSAESGIREYIGKGMSASLADMEDDGKLAIFVTNDKQMNYLFRDSGKGRFRDVAVEYGVPLPSYGMPVSGMGSDFRDVDNDGRPDIFFVALQNEGFPLFHNTGKRFFEEASVTNGLAQLANNMSGYSPAIVDFDNDGWKDLFVSCGHVQSVPLSRSMKIDLPNVVFRNRADGHWDALVDAAGFGSQPARRHRGAAFGDFDGDGRVDLVVTGLGAPAEIWMNRSPAANHWLDVELVGSTSNRDGIGAALMVVTASGRQFNHMTTAVGYASSSAGPVHFGIGRERTVKLLEVRWPGGKVQRIANLPADQVLKVTEPR